MTVGLLNSSQFLPESLFRKNRHLSMSQILQKKILQNIKSDLSADYSENGTILFLRVDL